MKTTIDLPPNLVHQLKLRALRERRKLKDLAAEFLQEGLARKSSAAMNDQPLFVMDKKTGLPVINCPKTTKRYHLSPTQLDELLMQQEVEWAHASA